MLFEVALNIGKGLTMLCKRSLLLSFSILILSLVVQAEQSIKIPILAYHRFGPKVTDSMMIKTSEFAQHLKWLKDNHYTVIPLRTVVNYFSGKGPQPPDRSVVITVDDGHKSVFTEMQPLVKKHHIPVTLFIYPSAISKATYAMTWEQLIQLKQTGLFDIQGHTYWHPNFKREKKKLSPAKYQEFVKVQLSKSKNVLDKKMNATIDLLAWPFGIYDDELEKAAVNAGYVMAFSIDARGASKSEKPMEQPRFLIVESRGPKSLLPLFGPKE